MLSPSIALLVSIAGILILLRLRVHVCFAVFAGSIILSLLLLPMPSIPPLMLRSLANYQTARLLVVVASALTLSRLMEEKGLLAELAVAMERITPRLAVHFIPAIIGLVPMPGGALVSATATRDLVERIGLPPEQGTFINYWFRHIWEFSLPLYPVIIIISALVSAPISFLVVRLLPMTALAIASGAVLSYLMLKNTRKVKVKPSRNLAYKFLRASWPILLLVLLVLVGLEAMIAFPLTLVILALQQRTRWTELRKAFKYGLDPKILFLLYAVMLYKSVIESSGATQTVFSNMQAMGMPALVILVTLPLLMGLATGLSIAFAGVAFPLLVPYFTSSSGINSPTLILAYVSGMIGMLLSPLHLCLILSAEYFKAKLAKVYKYILLPSLLLEAVAVIIYCIAS
jgi:integral membrane protein (TIGR00529 family)